MILSNLEQNGTLAILNAGETKAVVMLTDMSTTPFVAYYNMPNGYATWLSITVAGNVFSVAADNNLFSETTRSVVVQFCCMPVSGGTLQTQNVTVTQAADAVTVTFDPTTVALAYTAGATDDVTLAGIPTGAVTFVSVQDDWVHATFSSNTLLVITADVNVDAVERSTVVILNVDTRPFYLTVTQAANTATLTATPPTVALAASAGATDDVTLGGFPEGEAIDISTPDWLTASIAAGVLTLTALVNSATTSRTGSVVLTVVGKTLSIAVTQAGTDTSYGPLTLDTSSYVAPYSGGSVTVTATAMPANATGLTITVKRSGTCVQCADADKVITFKKVSDVAVTVLVAAQDLFDGEARAFDLTFKAGAESQTFLVTQDAPPALHRFFGQGDKFVKSATSAIVPTYLAPSTLQELLAVLKSTSWTQLSTIVSPLLVGANRNLVPTKLRSHEAFKTGYNNVTIDGTVMHEVAMGAAVYRFKFSEAAYGLTLRGLRFIVRSDAYCLQGLRVALETTNTTDTPSTNWDVVREGTGGHYKAMCAPSTPDPLDDLLYGLPETVVFDNLNITIDATTHLYVYLTMEDYRGLNRGWVYGSGVMNPVFDFFADDLISGVADYDTIARSSVERDSYPVVRGGDIISPRVDYAKQQESREIAVRSVVFGVSPSKTDPTPTDALAAIAFLSAQLAEKGMVSADLTTLPFRAWQPNQLGMTCSICRQIVGSSAPFEQRLIQTITPMLVHCAFPYGYVPTFIRLKHRVGQPSVTVVDADVRLSVFWLGSKAVTLQELDAFYARPGFAGGAGLLTVGTDTFRKLGGIQLPSTLAAGEELLIEISRPSGGTWGTLLFVPWIARVMATSLVANEPIGLAGVTVEENEILGTGWVPDVQLEV